MGVLTAPGLKLFQMKIDGLRHKVTMMVYRMFHSNIVNHEECRNVLAKMNGEGKKIKNGRSHS